MILLLFYLLLSFFVLVYKVAVDDANVRESWVLPVVLKFDGKPVVTENGNIVYQFEVCMYVTVLPMHYISEYIFRSD